MSERKAAATNSNKKQKGCKRGAQTSGAMEQTSEPAAAAAASAAATSQGRRAASSRTPTGGSEDSKEESSEHIAMEEGSRGSTAGAAAATDSIAARPFVPVPSSYAAAAAASTSLISFRPMSERTQTTQVGARNEGNSGSRDEEEQPRKKKKQDRQPSPAAVAADDARGLPTTSIDSDSLSVAFSFLNTRDFLSAIRVCRQWRAARTRKSAWPTLHVPSFIRALQNSSYGSPNRRSLVLNSMEQLRRLLARPGGLAMWRHVTELRLVRCEKLRFDNFPCLAALSLIDVPFASLKAALPSLAGRLEALVLQLPLRYSKSPSLLPLGQLRSLRILVISHAPNSIALAQLHQLAYLHIDSSNVMDKVPLMVVVRWLSVHHQLRSLSLGDAYYQYPWHDGTEAGIGALLRVADVPTLASAEETGLQLAASTLLQPPLDWHQPCGLTDLALGEQCASLFVKGASFFSGLPHLTRLERCESDYAGGVVSWLSSAPADGLARLRELHLTFIRWMSELDDTSRLSARLQPLKACTQLQVARLSFPLNRYRQNPQALSMPSELLAELLAAWSPAIEEVRFLEEIEVDLESSEKVVGSLATCHQLRVLELRLHTALPSRFGLCWFHRALSVLPHFLSPGLHRTGGRILDPTLLSCMLASPSWSVLRLRLPVSKMRDLSAQLASLELSLPTDAKQRRKAQCVQVFVHGEKQKDSEETSRVVCFRIIADEATDSSS